MAMRGFSAAAFTCKTGATAEGCALFVRDSRLTVLHVQQLRLRVVGAETMHDEPDVNDSDHVEGAVVGETKAGSSTAGYVRVAWSEPREALGLGLR